MSNAYTTVIPFNRLRLSAANVRRTGRDTAQYRTGIKALAASILSIHKQTGQGLLQNLVVHANGEFMDVAAGGRRFDGVALLIEQGEFPSDYLLRLAFINRWARVYPPFWAQIK